MELKVAKHIGWFLLPTIQWRPAMCAFGEVFPWQLTLWWGTLGLTLEATR